MKSLEIITKDGRYYIDTFYARNVFIEGTTVAVDTGSTGVHTFEDVINIDKVKRAVKKLGGCGLFDPSIACGLAIGAVLVAFLALTIACAAVKKVQRQNEIGNTPAAISVEAPAATNPNTAP